VDDDDAPPEEADEAITADPGAILLDLAALGGSAVVIGLKPVLIFPLRLLLLLLLPRRLPLLAAIEAEDGEESLDKAPNCCTGP
jgi:hypothetical protein